MHSSLRPRVLVACKQNWDSIAEIPYVLYKGGCQVDVLCSQNSWLLKNSFFHNWINISNLSDYPQKLTSLASTGQYDWIIPGDEELLNFLNKHISDESMFYKILPLNNIRNRGILGSKKGLSELCDKLSIISPKTLTYENNHDLHFHELQSFQFPVLVKLDHSSSGAGIVLCNNVESLLSELKNTIYSKHGFIIQEFIKGKDVGVESLFLDGQLLVYQSSVALEYTGSIFTPAQKREYFESSEIGKVVKSIGHTIGINGFASIQLIHNRTDDKYYLLEADLRPQAWFRYGEFTGHDFSIGVEMFTGQRPIDLEYYKNKERNVSKTEVSLFLRSIKAFAENRNFSILAEWIRKKSNWKFIPFYDTVFMKHIIRGVGIGFINIIKTRLGFTSTSRRSPS